MPEADMLCGTPPSLISSVAGSNVPGDFLAGVWPKHQRLSCSLDFVVSSSCVEDLSNGSHLTMVLTSGGIEGAGAETCMWLRLDLRPKVGSGLTSTLSV